MSCEHVRRQLGVYRDLDRTERRAVARHLRGCERCRQHWQDEQAVRALVCAVPLLDPPRSLESRLLAIPAVARRPLLPRPAPWLMLAAASLLLGAATLVWGPSNVPSTARDTGQDGAAVAGNAVGAELAARDGGLSATAVARRVAPAVAPRVEFGEAIALAAAATATPRPARRRPVGGKVAPASMPNEPEGGAPGGVAAGFQAAAGAEPAAKQRHDRAGARHAHAHPHI